jgi:glycosyltransferase involved in cell wall biosynthesis
MLSIIIPAHNEALRIGRTLDDYVRYFSNRLNYKFEIIVVINDCRDDTERIVGEYIKNFDQVKKYVVAGRGKGLAIRAGFNVANGDLVAFTDADGATRPEELGKLIEHIGRYDGAIASRWLPQSIRLPKQSLPRIIASRSWNFLVRATLGLDYKDTQCGTKLFTRAAIATILKDLVVDGFAFDIELLYKMKLKNLQILEIPISWNDQKGSTLSLTHHMSEMLRDLIRIKRSNTRIPADVVILAPVETMKQ